MPKKKLWDKEKTDDNNNSFIIGWADTVTLLLVFFVYIISISTIDTAKLTRATDSMKREFITQSDQTKEYLIPKLRQELEDYIVKENLENDISLDATPHHIVLNLGDKLLFKSGSAKLTKNGGHILDSIAKKLRVSGILIRIEGHTDDVDISTEIFPSNWHLSSYRSAEVINHLVSKGVDPSVCEIVGFADTRPLVSNTDEKSRKKNRRVLIHIQENFTELRQ